ncbi:MAG: dihydrofolate reductase family protein [Candidatus Devosia phytovorans]|uniref:Dihydrofolate reductase family protein n=1 Tax=Candidatus Devosia phytovorans TaxID=3121372 RepID=A0AAJ5VUX1_9HYPH|nr:dihydrofolate reductase family protein [Devosia sp.]WEK03918.1 MAG: dihydrofolate reductase family protein [Devosia sp.]
MLKRDGVIWHTAISLDGFAADRNDSLGFMMGPTDGPPPDNPIVDEVMANIGCTLGGRRGYDLSLTWDEVPKAYGLDDIPEYVVTRRPFPDDARYMFADGNDLPGAVAKAKTTANGRMVVILGPTLGSALLRAGLVDQIVVQVAPVVIGAGVRLFADTGEPPVQLELIHSSQSGQSVNLVYQPRRK